MLEAREVLVVQVGKVKRGVPAEMVEMLQEQRQTVDVVVLQNRVEQEEMVETAFPGDRQEPGAMAARMEPSEPQTREGVRQEQRRPGVRAVQGVSLRLAAHLEVLGVQEPLIRIQQKRGTPAFSIKRAVTIKNGNAEHFSHDNRIWSLTLRSLSLWTKLCSCGGSHSSTARSRERCHGRCREYAGTV